MADLERIALGKFEKHRKNPCYTMYRGGGTMLFSGRFDRVHAGHICSILRLGQRYAKVIIVVLDHPEQKFSIQYRVQVLRELLDMCKGNYIVDSNKTHFAKITKKELSHWKFDVYGAGNQECLKHIESLGYRVEYVERAYDYEATDDRTMMEIKKILS
jgi:nicotinamide mononucleotide adenylyltransferase